MPWGSVMLTDFWDVWDPPDAGGASSSTDAWERGLPEPGIQFEPTWSSDNLSLTDEYPSEQLRSEEPADSPCACDRPCLFFTRPAGCKNGDSCRFCHAWHPARVHFDRPSLKTRNRLKGIVHDFIAKGADLSLLEALAKVRPYAQRLLALEIVPLSPGEVIKPTPADGDHPLSQANLERWLSTPGATECNLSDDRSVTDSEMERFLDGLAS